MENKATQASDLSPDILEFALLMENTLRENRQNKHDWLYTDKLKDAEWKTSYDFVFMDSRKMFSELTDNVNKLDDETCLLLGLGAEEYSKRNIAEYAAWIGLYCMKYVEKTWILANDIKKLRRGRFSGKIDKNDPEYASYIESCCDMKGFEDKHGN